MLTKYQSIVINTLWLVSGLLGHKIKDIKLFANGQIADDSTWILYTSLVHTGSWTLSAKLPQKGVYTWLLPFNHLTFTSQWNTVLLLPTHSATKTAICKI